MKKRVTITLSEDLVKQAKIKAISDDTNFSAVVEKLLTQYLDSTTEKTSGTKKSDSLDATEING
jgi:hypothetical protein